MPYIVPADFRQSTQAWFTLSTGTTSGLVFDPTEISDTALADAIAAFSAEFDNFTNDHFAPEDALTLDLNGAGTPYLHLPKRIRNLTSVAVRNTQGSLTVQPTTVYRVTKSITGSTVDLRGFDFLSIIQPDYSVEVNLLGDYPPFIGLSGQRLTNGEAVWPPGVQSVQVVGDFSWPTTPERVKRAIALMVWDHFYEWNPERRRAVRVRTNEMDYDYTQRSQPTGITEVDQIIYEFQRDQGVAV